MSSDRVALFIDVDNVLILSQNSGLPFYLSLIIDRVRQQGTIMSSKAYADWASSLLRPFMGDFRANAIELVQLPTSMAAKEHKNTADIQLAVDALEMVFLPGSPDTVVIVGGDRDYVPLVQKLKRYGVFVMGIGVEAGVSSVLIKACDLFVYYDDILDSGSEEIEGPVSLPDPVEAYSLMQRAVEALGRDHRASTGASVHAMMKQLAPDFDLARYKTTLKALAQDAQREGYVGLTENPGSDFMLTVGSSPGTLVASVAESTKREYDYSTRDMITSSYRAILQDKRIPLLPWTIREQCVRLIWKSFDDRGDYGMSLDAMGDTLLDYTPGYRLPVSKQIIYKLLYTLNFAHCFSLHKNASTGYPVRIPLELHSPLHPVVDVEEAINRMHRNYLELLTGHSGNLHPDAVFDLLYGNEISDEEEKAERRKDVEKMCNDIKPLSALGQALLEASGRA